MTLLKTVFRRTSLRSSVCMSRYDPTDFKWRAIEPLLPNKPRNGRGAS